MTWHSDTGSIPYVDIKMVLATVADWGQVKIAHPDSGAIGPWGLAPHDVLSVTQLTSLLSLLIRRLLPFVMSSSP